MVYHTLLPSYFMPPSTCDRSHTWALAELDLPHNRLWYFSTEGDDPEQQWATEDVSFLVVSTASWLVLELPDSKKDTEGEGVPSIQSRRAKYYQRSSGEREQVPSYSQKADCII